MVRDILQNDDHAPLVGLSYGVHGRLYTWWCKQWTGGGAITPPADTGWVITNYSVHSELCWNVANVNWQAFAGGLRTYSVCKLQVAKDTLMFGPSWLVVAGCPLTILMRPKVISCVPYLDNKKEGVAKTISYWILSLPRK